MAAVAVLLASCASFTHLTHVGSTFPTAKECGKCHVDIYQEWSESDHAHAYTNPHFRAATNDYSFESCLGCHAPEPTRTDHTPAIRAAGREEGVTCVACHLDQGGLCGPLEPTGKVHPHPIGVRPAIYHSTHICGRCHEGTLKQWEGAPNAVFRVADPESVSAEKRTCQQCHMEAVTRRVTQATGGISNVLVALEKQVPQRRHKFCILGDARSRGAITLAITSMGDSVDVLVENHLPHSLPTGDFGFRVVTLEVFGIDADGHSILAGSWELAGESATAIPPQGTRTWSLRLGRNFKTARAVLTRRSYDGEALVLAETQVEAGRP
jgi:hypothetical protein